MDPLNPGSEHENEIRPCDLTLYTTVAIRKNRLPPHVLGWQEGYHGQMMLLWESTLAGSGSSLLL